MIEDPNNQGPEGDVTSYGKKEWVSGLVGDELLEDLFVRGSMRIRCLVRCPASPSRHSRGDTRPDRPSVSRGIHG